MRAAIVHYWLLNTRGGEKVLEALCRMLPDADLFTLFYDPERVPPAIRARRVHTSFLQPFRAHYRSMLPLMPMALESFDLREYDLVVSSESGPAKGVIVPSRARHVCYCHTPMRYLWDLYPAYRNQWTKSRWKRAIMTPLAHYLRMWDYSSAARVDEFAANSENVRRRIWKTYRRESVVIPPPAAVETFYWKPPEDYYLVVSELVAYKQVDSAVRVFSQNGRRLRVAGDGPEFKSLRRQAAPHVEFCGRVSDADLRELYARCRAFVMPGEEDFGITAVEALASGKPVIALGRGGALETIPLREPLGGFLYGEATDDSLGEAVKLWDDREKEVDPEALRRYVTKFSENEFRARMRPLLFPIVRGL
jgi:glycosyltransferase involved in cell wall biosynthesis